MIDPTADMLREALRENKQLKAEVERMKRDAVENAVHTSTTCGDMARRLRDAKGELKNKDYQLAKIAHQLECRTRDLHTALAMIPEQNDLGRARLLAMIQAKASKEGKEAKDA
jgi:hypothetical protein